jgi:hypothetical protein
MYRLIPSLQETCAPDIPEPVHNDPQETETAADVFEPVDGPVAEPAKETGEFAQSSGVRESSNDGQHVQLPARLAARKVFIVKRFNRCHLDVKPFLPTLGHTQLENVRSEDRKSRLAPGSDPPPHTTPPEELRRVDIEALDTTVKTIAGSRDDGSLHLVTGVSIGRSPVLICRKMTEVNGKYVPSEYKLTCLGPGHEPPPAAVVWSLGFGDVKLTFLMVYIRRMFTFVFRAQGAHSRGQQHCLNSCYVDKPDPDPEPPPGCLNSSSDGGDQGVEPEEGCSLHGLSVSLIEHRALHQKYVSVRPGIGAGGDWSASFTSRKKRKRDLQHPQGDIMRGWHTDKVRPYNLGV